jgi:hypothetical protein
MPITLTMRKMMLTLARNGRSKHANDWKGYEHPRHKARRLKNPGAYHFDGRGWKKKEAA